jgi:uncharacterized membrane protein YtjA (UPF0391 family)
MSQHVNLGIGTTAAPNPDVTAPRRRLHRSSTMLYWSATFFLIALLSAVLGFGNLAAGAADIAKVLFFLFLVLFVISFIVGLFSRGRRGV